MCNKYLIIFGLFLAYSLLLAHTVIPHHHHENKQEAEQHHHNEHTGHHHDNEESEGHGHTPHFVHSADFGNYILNPSVSVPDFSKIHSGLLFIFAGIFAINSEFTTVKYSHPPESPPPLCCGLYSAFSLRGPPYFISQA